MPKKASPNPDTMKEIQKQIEQISSICGQRPGQVFEDWLQIVEQTLTMLPEHLEAAVKTGRLAEDSPEAVAVFDYMYKKYPEACWPHFTAAFVALLEMPEKWVARDLPEIYGPDVLGAIYMELCANPGSGQFFTPWSVASMMAQIVMDDIEETIFAHLRKAADKATAAEPVLRAFYYPATLMAVMGLGEVTPCAEAVMACYEPITICDPCCGSGIMQLAGAYAIPPWALHAGLVQFYGVDIDETCVRMAKINFLLYDLNGSYAKCALALSELELQSLPPDHCQVYSIAQVFQAQGLLEEVEEIKQDIRHGLFACLQFDFMTEEAQDAM